jgi:hypothetical protein
VVTTQLKTGVDRTAELSRLSNQVDTADNGPRLSSAPLTVMEESMPIADHHVTSGRCS